MWDKILQDMKYFFGNRRSKGVQSIVKLFLTFWNVNSVSKFFVFLSTFSFCIPKKSRTQKVAPLEHEVIHNQNQRKVQTITQFEGGCTLVVFSMNCQSPPCPQIAVCHLELPSCHAFRTTPDRRQHEGFLKTFEVRLRHVDNLCVFQAAVLSACGGLRRTHNKFAWIAQAAFQQSVLLEFDQIVSKSVHRSALTQIVPTNLFGKRSPNDTNVTDPWSKCRRMEVSGGLPLGVCANCCGWRSCVLAAKKFDTLLSCKVSCW